MITVAALTKQCQDKGLTLYQNLTIGTRKVYCVTPNGTKDVLNAGYLGYVAKFVKGYTPTAPAA
jgi:hypothetical protein